MELAFLVAVYHLFVVTLPLLVAVDRVPFVGIRRWEARLGALKWVAMISFALLARYAPFLSLAVAGLVPAWETLPAISRAISGRRVAAVTALGSAFLVTLAFAGWLQLEVVELVL